HSRQKKRCCCGFSIYFSLSRRYSTPFGNGVCYYSVTLRWKTISPRHHKGALPCSEKLRKKFRYKKSLRKLPGGKELQRLKCAVPCRKPSRRGSATRTRRSKLPGGRYP